MNFAREFSRSLEPMEFPLVLFKASSSSYNDSTACKQTGEITYVTPMSRCSNVTRTCYRTIPVHHNSSRTTPIQHQSKVGLLNFPHYRPFVRVFHRSPLIPHTDDHSQRALIVFFIVCVNKPFGTRPLSAEVSSGASLGKHREIQIKV